MGDVSACCCGGKISRGATVLKQDADVLVGGRCSCLERNIGDITG